jgi:hypothetical protein
VQHDSCRIDDVRRGAGGALRRQQREVTKATRVQQPGCFLQRARAEADQPLAVNPREVVAS